MVLKQDGSSNILGVIWKPNRDTNVGVRSHLMEYA